MRLSHFPHQEKAESGRLEQLGDAEPPLINERFEKELLLVCGERFATMRKRKGHAAIGLANPMVA